MQPEAITQPLFSCTIHLINPFTISEKLESGGISNVSSCFRAFINVSVYKGKLWEIIAQSRECRQDLAAHTTPDKPRNNIKTLSYYNSDQDFLQSIYPTITAYVPKTRHDFYKPCTV